MMEAQLQKNFSDPYGGTGPVQCLRQVVDVLRKQVAPLNIVTRDADRAFASVCESETAPRRGIQAVEGRLLDDGVLAIQLACVRGGGDVRIPAVILFDRLAALGEKCHVVSPPSGRRDDSAGLWLEIRVAATPMSFSRESAFVAQIAKTDELAAAIQSEIPHAPDERELDKLYANFSDCLEPVRPWQGQLPETVPDLADWSAETLEFMEGGASVAIESPCPVVARFMLSILALEAASFGRTLGTLAPASINARGLVAIARKAPGIVTVPAMRISLGVNVYEMNAEVSCVISILAAAGKPMLFHGDQSQLQSVFGGGQGGVSDPLLPVLRHAPEIDIATLARFAIHYAGQRVGGLSESAAAGVLRTTLAALAGFPTATQRRMVETVAARCVAASTKGRTVSDQSALQYAASVADLSETLAGLSPRPRVCRKAAIQERYSAALATGNPAHYFRKYLLGQDAALEQLAERLTTECLTRPTHQPLRYCAQGTPGTGKSESAILLARLLDVPYVNIDAASMPDSYTAAAQLLGSGRGIVGSFQSGRLEQAAKCHGGAVIEVSDLDHAVPAVRASLADLFLQALETGEAQSAAGGMFSCADLIFAFTMNLPDGMDEAAYKHIGFGAAPTRDEVAADVAEHIKRMLSGAFLSRVGAPIVFGPLDETALARIVEKAIHDSIAEAALRLGAEVSGVTLDPDVGERAVALLHTRIVSRGARALLEHGRCLASRAVLDLKQRVPDLAQQRLRVSFDAEGNMRIEAVEFTEEQASSRLVAPAVPKRQYSGGCEPAE